MPKWCLVLSVIASLVSATATSVLLMYVERWKKLEGIFRGPRYLPHYGAFACMPILGAAIITNYTDKKVV